MRENEWQMQARLTPEWVKNGTQLGGEPLFLAAWEVMTNWKINDSSRDWRFPSIDFLFLDRSGGIWLVEMKREVAHPKDAWLSLCQVSYRVVALKKTFSFSNLCSAHADCWSGVHGRVPLSTPLPLTTSHQAFFQLSEPLSPEHFGQGEWKRVIASTKFNHQFNTISEQFSPDKAIDDVRATIQLKYPTWEKSLEFKRLKNNVNTDDWSSLLSKPTTWTLEPSSLQAQGTCSEP